ncbi:MAG TPA: xanthine dehydrogenase family protein molybdopterin-binding subunit [Chloroflexota bacterium]|nr:xanthine dehydrogenase family protein molybdopterin-binding subunit [Chloroflexota bacterium]
MSAPTTVIGTSAPRVDGIRKVTGQAIYGADVIMPGMLWCKLARSTMSHARLVRVDATKARQIPGVHAVITADDIPDRLWGRALEDMPVLARGKVRFVGEPIAAVAADDPDTAEEAAMAVEIEYEELPAIFDAREAMKPGAASIHEDVAKYKGLPKPVPDTPNTMSRPTWGKGDIEAGFRDAEVVIEHEFYTQPQHQGHLEPHACIVKFDEQGRLQVHDANKAPFRSAKQVAPLLDMPDDGVDYHATALGGDFGGKGSALIVPAAAYLAKRTGRPVKYVMTYVEELIAANPRHSGHISIKTGLKKDGTITARHATVVWDSGAYGAMKPAAIVSLGSTAALMGAYNIPHVLCEGFTVYTNTVPRGHVRAPAGPQAHFAVESHMDMIAAQMGLDPLEFRRKNALHDGDSLADGHALEDVREEQTIEACVERSGWRSPKKGGAGRGMSVTQWHVNSGVTGARLTLQRDGKLILETGMPDTGTGLHTVMRQVVAEELGVAPTAVDVRTGGTLEMPEDTGVGGSRATISGGSNAALAAQAMKDELAGRGESIGNTSEPITVETKFPGAHGHQIAVTCQVAEVTVDRDTGQFTIDRLTSAHDVGQIIHPTLHQGQIDGGIAHGLGQAIMEDLQIVDGRVTAAHLGDYKMPVMGDMPELQTILVTGAHGPGFGGSKGIGETANLGPGAAIANAIYDACGVRVTSLPITAEKVYEGLRAKR